jgi:hypothetical protein
MGEVLRLRPITEDIASHFPTEINESSLGTQIPKKDEPYYYTAKMKDLYTDFRRDDLSGSIIDTKDLYPLYTEHSFLSSAIQLLEEGIKYLNESIKMLNKDDLLSSDDALQRFQALLPELFCCRNLGDGFGAVVNSIFHSLKNLDGIPLNGKQLEAVLKTVRRIYTEPYIAFNEAVEEIMSLENTELEMEPPYIEFAADLLNE